MPDNDVRVASADYITNLGKKYLDWSKGFATAHYQSLQLKLTPGSMPQATAYKQVFDDNSKSLQERLDKLRQAFYDFGLLVQQAAQKYVGVEDINKDDAERMRDIVNGFANDYQGVSVVIAPPVNGYNMPPS